MTQFALLLLSLLILPANSLKHFVKALYQPYGSKMCKQMNEDSNSFYIYTKEDLSCRRVAQNSEWSSNEELLLYSSSLTCKTTDTNSTTSSTATTVVRATCEVDFVFSATHSWSLTYLIAVEGNLTGKEPPKLPVDRNYTYFLHHACKTGKLCLVKYILGEGKASINCKTRGGRTPVMTAALGDQWAVYDFLVKQGCTIHDVDVNNNNLLHLACVGGNTKIITSLFHQNFEIDKRAGNRLTPVMIAVSKGHRNVLDLLIINRCNLTKLHNGNNLLHIASLHGHVGIVRYIMSLRLFSIESRGVLNCTPVLLAAYRGKTSVVQLLVSEGCNLNAVNQFGSNLLHLACFSRSVGVVRYIISQKLVDIESRGNCDCTPVMLAALKGSFEIFEYLVQKGCNLRVVSSVDDNILHLACAGGNISIVKYVLSRDIVSIESRGEFGYTPVMKAVDSGHIEVVKLLIERGCSMRAVDDRDNTVLHVASLRGNVDMMRYLMSLEVVDKNLRNKNGSTALQLAISLGY